MIKEVKYKINDGIIFRKDLKYNFASRFDTKSGMYIRTNVFQDNKQTKEEPFMASFPHLIDVGIMGHCIHGKSGLCQKAGIDCYQSGLFENKPNMTLDNFKKIANECHGYTDQFALGGRGDPDCHENFGEILEYCREKNIVPNYTTSGFAFNKEKAELSKKYCGAVAVSWYRSAYTLSTIDMLVDASVKTNVHYVLGKNTIEEAIERLRNNSFPNGINAIIFLLYKPVGQGKKDNILDVNQDKIKEFFDIALNKKHPFKIGFDSCTVPAILNYSNNVLLESIDTCEGGRFSMYIGSDMIATPCSFDVEKKYGYDIKDKTVYDAWNSIEFKTFRGIMRNACPNCKKREYCLGGCPLDKDTVLCNNGNRD